MKRYFGFVLAIFLGATGCSNSPSPSSSTTDQTATDSTAPVTAPPTDDSSIPVPQGALYTLHCATFTGPSHILDAKRTKELLIRSTGSKDWYVVHSAEESDLYFGYYKTFDDRSQLAEYTRAQTDRARVSSLVSQDGDAMFSEVVFTSINMPDPPAPKEWDLASNPGYWTLQIAVYKGSPERKQAAVDAVRGFREHGIEAYFRHGPATSEVYIGSWPRQAVREQESSVAQSDDPNQPLLVVPGPLPQGVDSDKVYDSQGRKMKVVMPNLQIVDESLKRATEQYPYYYVNGEVAGRRMRMKDHSTQTIPWPSYLVQVPHDNDDQDQPTKSDSDQAGAPHQGDTGDSTPTVPGLGGLR
ncbi:MAG: hypothetical protein ABSB42_21155 [Tepidisphaeraceae bacterium]|jgi:hypothetical protein